jgi:uncharacterized membrane protein
MIAAVPDTLLRVGVSKEGIVFITSMLPVLELRGAIPLALGMKVPLHQAFFLAVCGNMIPVIPILLLLKPAFSSLRHFELFDRFFKWLFKRTRNRSKVIEMYGTLGLILFVATPLPITGAWTGCVAARLLGLRVRYAFPAIVIGVLIAGVIVSLGSLGVIRSFSYFLRFF